MRLKAKDQELDNANFQNRINTNKAVKIEKDNQTNEKKIHQKEIEVLKEKIQGLESNGQERVDEEIKRRDNIFQDKQKNLEDALELAKKELTKGKENAKKEKEILESQAEIKLTQTLLAKDAEKSKIEKDLEELKAASQKKDAIIQELRTTVLVHFGKKEKPVGKLYFFCNALSQTVWS